MTDSDEPLDSGLEWHRLEAGGHPNSVAQQAFAHFRRSVGGAESAERWDAQGGYERLQRRVAQQYRPLETRERSVAPRRTARVAALGTVLAAAGLAVAVYVGSFSGGDRPSTTYSTTYSTRAGERRIITLHDGSRVTLAPATTLRVPKAFGAKSRTMRLEGEAYFDVASSAGVPFVVQTAMAETRVTGTEFGVAHYPGDRDTRVAVVRGKVSVRGSRDRAPVVLVAGMIARAADSVTTAVSSPNDVTAATNWVSGHLVFHNARVADVLVTLRRWYDLDIRVADTALANRHLTASLDFPSSHDLITTLSLLLNVSARVDSSNTTTRIITLTPRTIPRLTPRRIERDTLIPHVEVGR
jgi:transmembrane sensor